MPELLTTFDRSGLGDLKDDEEAKLHMSSLEGWKKRIADLLYEMPSKSKDINDRIKEVIQEVDDEIDLCRYYLEYNERKRTCPYFKRWQLVKAKDREDLNDWQKKDAGDAWLYTNGRIKTSIEILKSAPSIKVTLRYRNASGIYHFLDSEKQGKVAKFKHFRKDESAKAYAEVLKREAFQYISDPKRLYTYRSEVHNTEKLLELLHLTQTIRDDEPLSETLEDECFYCLIQNRPNEKCPEYVKRVVGECKGKLRGRHEN